MSEEHAENEAFSRIDDDVAVEFTLSGVGTVIYDKLPSMAITEETMQDVFGFKPDNYGMATWAEDDGQEGGTALVVEIGNVRLILPMLKSDEG